jgi:excisionase family DNA binding protein
MTAAVLTLDELADYLKLPAATLEQQADRGHLPGRKIAGEWRFLQAAIDDWLRQPDDNRPLFPRHAAAPPIMPIAPSDNPWAEVASLDKDAAEIAEITAELRGELDF